MFMKYSTKNTGRYFMKSTEDKSASFNESTKSIEAKSLFLLSIYVTVL